VRLFGNASLSVRIFETNVFHLFPVQLLSSALFLTAVERIQKERGGERSALPPGESRCSNNARSS